MKWVRRDPRAIFSATGFSKKCYKIQMFFSISMLENIWYYKIRRSKPSHI